MRTLVCAQTQRKHEARQKCVLVEIPSLFFLHQACAVCLVANFVLRLRPLPPAIGQVHRRDVDHVDGAAHHTHVVQDSHKNEGQTSSDEDAGRTHEQYQSWVPAAQHLSQVVHHAYKRVGCLWEAKELRGGAKFGGEDLGARERANVAVRMVREAELLGAVGVHLHRVRVTREEKADQADTHQHEIELHAHDSGWCTSSSRNYWKKVKRASYARIERNR